MENTRLDKWLWAARFFKTRALAAEAIGGGRVELNGEKAKRARAVKPGDRIRLRLGAYEYLLTVREVSGHRGPASAAQALYEEDPASRERRDRVREQQRLARDLFAHGRGKPGKRERRELRKLKE